MTHDKEIEELIEVGEKATRGKWTVHQCQECHVPSDRLSFHYPIRKEDGLTEIIPDENGDQDYPNIGNDMVFAATSANARPALKALLAENKRYRQALDKSVEDFEKIITISQKKNCKPEIITYCKMAVSSAKQALNPSEENRK